MAQSAHRIFSDPYPYQKAIRAAEVETVVTGRGHFSAELIRIDLVHLWMQSGEEELAQISHAANSRERAIIFFLSDPDQPEMHHSGMTLGFGEIMVSPAAPGHYRWTTGPSRWSTMSLSHTDLAAAGRALVGRELHAPAAAYRVRPHPSAMQRLLALHRTARDIAKNAPDILANAEVARALEEPLVAAMIACLTETAPDELSAAGRQHQSIMRRFEDLLAANRDRPLYLAEICQALGASERTLRNCCHEHFGVGPIRYLWLRRMHLARRALVFADPKTSCVTDIALNHGFWELGRFAVAYKKLFGESPSASLQHAPMRDWRFDPDPLALPDSESA